MNMLAKHALLRTAPKKVCTLGYEGAQLSDVIATLQAADVTCLIDVRQLAISRRPGFAKSALSAGLEAAGIRYEHLRGLGDPKAGREAARAGDYELFKRIFSQHMTADEAQADLSRLERLAKTERVCLMCYERDPTTCHRSIVLNHLSSKMSVKVHHLGVRSRIAKEVRSVAAANSKSAWP